MRAVAFRLFLIVGSLLYPAMPADCFDSVMGGCPEGPPCPTIPPNSFPPPPADVFGGCPEGPPCPGSQRNPSQPGFLPPGAEPVPQSGPVLTEPVTPVPQPPAIIAPSATIECVTNLGFCYVVGTTTLGVSCSCIADGKEVFGYTSSGWRPPPSSGPYMPQSSPDHK